MGCALQTLVFSNTRPENEKSLSIYLRDTDSSGNNMSYCYVASLPKTSFKDGNELPANISKSKAINANEILVYSNREEDLPASSTYLCLKKVGPLPKFFPPAFYI